MRDKNLFSPQFMMIGIVTIIILFFVGCGFVGRMMPKEKEPDNSTRDLVVVGYSQIGSESVWRTANSASIQSALTKENGYFLVGTIKNNFLFL